MDYNSLFSFVVFAEHLNFTRAARQIHLSQPALHVQIKKLGEAVGSPLYYRRGRTLSLTLAGERLAAFGREVRDQGQAILEELSGARACGPLVLASGQGAFLYLLGQAIRRFPKEKWPLRLLTMGGPEVIGAVREARVQVGVVAADAPPSDLDVTPLRTVGQVVMLPLSHRLAPKKRISPRELSGERIVVAPAGRPHREMLAQALGVAGVEWHVAVEATGWELMLHFARCGVGIAVVNDFCPPPRGMVALPLEGAPLVTYYLLRRSGLRTPAAEALHRLIVETVGRGSAGTRRMRLAQGTSSNPRSKPPRRGRLSPSKSALTP